MNGLIFDIQRFALHDGPGIRTTVFLKGCPLRCLWCHNPESQSFQPELSFRQDKCRDCLSCVVVCQTGAHEERNGRHELTRSRCELAGRCVKACPHEALQIIGRKMNIEEIIEEVLKDKDYYDRSGGGLTISGGEPLAQFEFTRTLLQTAKAHGIHTCLDTSGFASQEKFAALLEDVDLFLYDYKATNDVEHKYFAGASNHSILRNLEFLYEHHARLVLRCPLVSGVNDSLSHLEGIAALAAKYPKLQGIEIMPYHAMGRDKAMRIGKPAHLKDLQNADETTKAHWLETLRELGCSAAM
ncbi:glycyl-radical enzyme activating protein [bacterium]|nr:glycyl-radical enzyme activating protein [bacterium]